MERAKEIFYRIRETGEKAINEFILKRQAEAYFLDFKQSNKNGQGDYLDDKDLNNLKKSISGFGNSEGGVIIWGISTSKIKEQGDVADSKCIIKNVKRFVGWLNNAISGCTIPPHPRVENYPIIIDKENNGFVATYIAKSELAPHQVVGEGKYYIRSGSNFSPAPHGVLAGMFGKRPQAKLVLTYAVYPAELKSPTIVKGSVILNVRNDGPGIANHVFVNGWYLSESGPNCKIAFSPMIMNWPGFWSYGRHFNMICNNDYRLAPGAHVQPMKIELEISPPFDDDIKIEGKYGCEGAPFEEFTIECLKVNIESAYKDLMQKQVAGKLPKEDFEGFLQKIIKSKISLSESNPG